MARSRATLCPRWQFDCAAIAGQDWLVGVDEAGRGALAGPVVAAAVAVRASYFQALPEAFDLNLIRDSKQIREAQRETLFEQVSTLAEQGLALHAIGEGSVDEINRLDILGATCLAMWRAIQQLQEMGLPHIEFGIDELFQESGKRVRILVDGIHLKRLELPHEGVVKGDDRSHVIALASILAKVSRDRKMRDLDRRHSHFLWASNKGYGSRAHCDAIRAKGPSKWHRKQFIHRLIHR
ncbi:MAG: ribonuclease HII [Opitutales bacterium]|nr:ribonuclease HII [Opitutales bacterium]